jgi:hypothetical protein
VDDDRFQQPDPYYEIHESLTPRVQWCACSHETCFVIFSPFPFFAFCVNNKAKEEIVFLKNILVDRPRK